MIKPIKLGLGAPYGTGKQIQSWIHIDDLVNMYFFALQHELKGVYNAVAPNPVENRELIKSLVKVLKRPLIIPNIPKFLLKMILGEMHIVLVQSQKVSAQKILKKGFQFKYPLLQSAVQDLFQ